MSSLTAPPGFVRLASGRVVPAQTNFGMKIQKPKRFLIVFSYYEGDRDATEALASLVAELERTRNHDADILLFRRADCRELSAAVQQKLAAKFDKVHVEPCRRSHAKGYPFGPNEMFCDLVMMMSQIAPYATEYFAWLNMEPDAVPTRPGWIGELIAGWHAANAQRKSAIGHIHNDPVRHLNGLAVYATDLFRRVADRRLMGSNPQICYDIHFANILLPHAVDSPLIYFQYRQPSITPDELFAPRKGGIVPALYHGVKDGSAIAAVKARYITFTDVPKPTPPPKLEVADYSVPFAAPIDPVVAESATTAETKTAPHVALLPLTPADPSAIILGQTPPPSPAAPQPKRLNVYTYFSKRGRHSAEDIAIADAWRKGWSTRGFNPVVLTVRDAAKHEKFDAFAAAVEKLPCATDRGPVTNGFYRWLALDTVGGGLMVDIDVLPDEFVPACIADISAMSFYSNADFCGMYLSKEEAAKWVATLMAYDANLANPDDMLGDKLHVTDTGVARQKFLQVDVRALLTRISAEGMDRKSTAMEKFLGAKTR